MKSELRAGGLALVVGNNPHTGKCVTLVSLVMPGQSFKNPLTGDTEFLSLAGVKCWLVTGDVWPLVNRHDRGWALFSPTLLMPIDGDDHQEGDQMAKGKPAELTA